MLKYISTTNEMTNHLRSSHKINPAAADDKFEQKVVEKVIDDILSEPESRKASKKHANNNNEQLQSAKLSSKKIEELNFAVVKLIVSTYSPLAFVNSDGVISLMEIAVPAYKPPSRQFLANTLIPKYYNGN
jgi:hypothetical protein